MGMWSAYLYLSRKAPLRKLVMGCQTNHWCKRYFSPSFLLLLCNNCYFNNQLKNDILYPISTVCLCFFFLGFCLRNNLQFKLPFHIFILFNEMAWCELKLRYIFLYFLSLRLLMIILCQHNLSIDAKQT